MLTPFSVLRRMNFYPCRAPLLGKSIGVLHEEIGAVDPLIVQRHDAEMDLDPVPCREAIPAAVIRASCEAEPLVVRQRRVEISVRENRRDPSQAAHRLMLAQRLNNGHPALRGGCRPRSRR